MNFSPRFLEQVKKVCERKTTKWINLPPGSDNKHKNALAPIEGAPDIKFRQKEGERTCLSYSFASALHHVGAKQIASEVHSMSKKISEKCDTLKLFVELLQKHSTPLNFKNLKANQWNIFENKDEDLVVVLLQGSDGKEDHCVTLYRKWIFNSNFTNALPLSKDSLDLCCSSDDCKDEFVKVVKAMMCTNYMHLIHKKKGKKRKRKN